METEGANIPEKNKKKEGFENIGFNTKDFLSLLWRKKYWIILSVLVCTAASLYNYSRQVNPTKRPPFDLTAALKSCSRKNHSIIFCN